MDVALITVGAVLAECEPACRAILATGGVEGSAADDAIGSRKSTLGFAGAGVLPRKAEATFAVTTDDMCPDSLLTVVQVFLMPSEEFEEYAKDARLLGADYKREEGGVDAEYHAQVYETLIKVIMRAHAAYEEIDGESSNQGQDHATTAPICPVRCSS